MIRILCAMTAVFVAISSTSPLLSQSRLASAGVSPRLGIYAPYRDFGQVAEGANVSPIKVQPALSLGVSMTGDTPLRWLDLRGQVLYAPSAAVVAQRRIGETPCGTNCVRFLYANDDIGESHILVGSADMVLHLPSWTRVRPYVIGGVGTGKYWFAPRPVQGEFSGSLVDDPFFVALHVGAGLDVNVGRGAFNIEVADLVGQFDAGPGVAPGYSASGQHDVSLNVGFRIYPFR